MTYENIEQSKVLEDCIKTMKHIPNKIINELYLVDVNPRFNTLILFVRQNYPQYDNDLDLTIIWDHAHSGDRMVRDLMNEHIECKQRKTVKP
jgi:negative regulator of genetic competence, sporulation and motility